jgi:hypothetical protein
LRRQLRLVPGRFDRVRSSPIARGTEITSLHSKAVVRSTVAGLRPKAPSFACWGVRTHSGRIAALSCSIGANSDDERRRVDLPPGQQNLSVNEPAGDEGRTQISVVRDPLRVPRLQKSPILSVHSRPRHSTHFAARPAGATNACPRRRRSRPLLAALLPLRPAASAVIAGRDRRWRYLRAKCVAPASSHRHCGARPPGTRRVAMTRREDQDKLCLAIAAQCVLCLALAPDRSQAFSSLNRARRQRACHVGCYSSPAQLHRTVRLVCLSS